MAVADQLNAALAGRYQVEREIGAGGMATVYLARDLRHDRYVALKVLNPELGALLGYERFLAEIRITANLQHPNLLPLFDSGEADGMLFYVMPYVEGQSLRARLMTEKHLGIDEALHIASAVAGALEHAHARGVVHRDLKPENILLQSGQPVVADFGIALAISRAGGQRLTQTGISLGTPHYMSPEQATGDRQVDARSDVYSLGAVLYEMLAGEPPHTGATAQAVIARVLTDRPRPLRSVRDTVPEHVAHAVDRALAKLSADRFHSAQDFALALTGAQPVAPPAGLPTPASASGGVRVGSASRQVRAAVPWMALIAAAILAAWGWRRKTAADDAVVRFRLELPQGEQIDQTIIGKPFALSPDGRTIVYLASDTLGRVRLHRRRMDELESDVLDGTDAARNPVFSPDGQWIAFVVNNELKKIPVAGGTPETLGPIGGAPTGLSWTREDTIIGGGPQLLAFSSGGGAPRVVATADRSRSIIGLRWPMALPNGRTVIVAELSARGVAAATLSAVSLSDGRVQPLNLAGTSPLAYHDGMLFYGAIAGGIMAVPFDARRSRVTGNPVPVAQDVLVEQPSATKAAIAGSGDLIYQNSESLTRPLLYGSDGTVRSLIDLPHALSTPRYSPDGRRVAFTVATGQSLDVWVYDIATNTLTRLTTDGSSTRPEWSPDGQRILYRSERSDGVGLYWQPADGSGSAEVLFKTDVDPFEGILSPDGRRLIYRSAPGEKNSRDIFYVDLPDVAHPVPLVVSPYAEEMPRLSPDGRWMAYESEESSQFEVYVRPFPGAGPRIQVSTSGGTEPMWSRDGRTLFYRTTQGLVAASVSTAGTFAVGARRTVLEGDFVRNASHQNYDVTPDGRHYLMIRRAGDESRTIVVHNWLAAVRRQLAATH